MITYKEIARLVRLLENSQLGLIELGDNGRKIRLTKYPKKDQQPVSNSLKKIGAAINLTENKHLANKIFIQRSTLIGIVHLAAAADAEKFVEVGDRVAKGQPLCLIKSLGLDYQIISEVSGVIRKICITENEPVDYDKSLFEIEKDE